MSIQLHQHFPFASFQRHALSARPGHAPHAGEGSLLLTMMDTPRG